MSNFRQKLEENTRLRCFEEEKPEDINLDQWKKAREFATSTGKKLGKEQESSAFYFYYMGASFKEIAEKLGTTEACVIYTALFYGWSERKSIATSLRAGEKITKADHAAVDLISDSLVATAAIYKSQILQAIQDPSKAQDCPFIPKNFKELKILMELMQNLQSQHVPDHSGKANVNILNVPGGYQPQAYNESVFDQPLNNEKPAAEEAVLLEEGKEDENKLKLMKMLQGETSDKRTR